MARRKPDPAPSPAPPADGPTQAAAAPAPPAAELVLPPVAEALPGAAALDRPLVDRAVHDLNRIHAAKGLETAREMGEYIVSTFFGGDAAAFDAHGRSHISFGALAQRDDLQVSKSAIWYAVKLLPQLRQLPQTVAQALPMSHHRLLVHVDDPKAKVKLAEKAVKKGLSKRQLEGEIEKLKKRDPAATPRGRRPLPGFVKAFNRLKKVAEAAELTEVDESALRSFGLDNARRYLDEVEQGLAQLQAVREQLAAHVAAVEARGEGPA